MPTAHCAAAEVSKGEGDTSEGCCNPSKNNHNALRLIAAFSFGL